ncbi:Uncharacterised protein [uncultured archaeon]|nr:Uncharacterised protein [uncultured archaeon]
MNMAAVMAAWQEKDGKAKKVKILSCSLIYQ